MTLADDIERALRRAQHEALLEIAHVVAERAKQLMPVGDPALDPSPEIALRERTRVESRSPNLVKVIVDTEYAARQEFDLNLKHPRGGGPRFLQRAVQEVTPLIGERVALRVRTNLGGSVHRGRRR